MTFIKLFIIGMIIFASISNIFPQSTKSLHKYELILNTANGQDSITFQISPFSAKIWRSHSIGENSTYLTNLSKYIYPDDIKMPGNYDKGDLGWDTDAWPDRDHVMGRGLSNYSERRWK